MFWLIPQQVDRTQAKVYIHSFMSHINCLTVDSNRELSEASTGSSSDTTRTELMFAPNICVHSSKLQMSWCGHRAHRTMLHACCMKHLRGQEPLGCTRRLYRCCTKQTKRRLNKWWLDKMAWRKVNRLFALMVPPFTNVHTFGHISISLLHTLYFKIFPIRWFLRHNKKHFERRTFFLLREPSILSGNIVLILNKKKTA